MASVAMDCGPMWPMGISTAFQRPPTVLLQFTCHLGCAKRLWTGLTPVCPSHLWHMLRFTHVLLWTPDWCRLIDYLEKKCILLQCWGWHPFQCHFSIEIQILWTLHCAFISMLVKWSLQNFAHATTARLSWHVQKFVVIWYPVIWITSRWSIRGIWTVNEIL